MLRGGGSFYDTGCRFCFTGAVLAKPADVLGLSKTERFVRNSNTISEGTTYQYRGIPLRWGLGIGYSLCLVLLWLCVSHCLAYRSA